MAHLDSFIKLKGRIGDLIFYKTKNGYLAREKGGISGDRIANDPKFQRTRENGAEFGRAAKASKQLRNGLLPVTQYAKDATMSNRMSAAMLKVVQADGLNGRGERMVLDAETELLSGFEFNASTPLRKVFTLPVVGSIDRASGALTVAVSGFDPDVHLFSPPGASHFQFRLGGLQCDFGTGDQQFGLSESTLLPVKGAVDSFALACTLEGPLEGPVFLAFGLSFFQEVNGKLYTLSNGVHNTACILLVSGV